MTVDRWRLCHHCDCTYLVCKLINLDGHGPCCASCDHPSRDKEEAL